GNSIGSSDRYSSEPLPWTKRPTTVSPARTRAALPDLQVRVRCPEVTRKSETGEESGSTLRVSKRSTVSARLRAWPAGDTSRAPPSASARTRDPTTGDFTSGDSIGSPLGSRHRIL